MRGQVESQNGVSSVIEFTKEDASRLQVLQAKLVRTPEDNAIIQALLAKKAQITRPTSELNVGNPTVNRVITSDNRSGF